MSTRRTWHRVEAPDTFRGHALTASFGADPWWTWENADGSWSLRYGDGETLSVPDYVTARMVAERERTRAPREANPSGGARSVNHFQVAASRAQQVCRAVPLTWVTGPCALLPDGTVDMRVRAGFGPRVHTELQRQGVPFRVLITEDPR